MNVHLYTNCMYEQKDSVSHSQFRGKIGSCQHLGKMSGFRVTLVLLSVLINSLLSNPAGSSLDHEAGK